MKKTDSCKYTKIFFVCLIMLLFFRLIFFWRNMQKQSKTAFSFDFYLSRIDRNCYYQAKGIYSFELPNCATYELNRDYLVVARQSLATDNDKQYLKNIDVMSFTPIKQNTILGFFHLKFMSKYLRQFREGVIALIKSTFYRHFSPLSAPLMVGLVFGNQTSPLPKWQREEFITLGLSHLIAVSGTHLTIFIFLFNSLFISAKHCRLFGVVVIIAACFFSWLAGNPASALRALFMLVFTLITRNFLLSFLNQFYNLFLTVLLMLLLEVNYLGNAGFYLSVSSTLAVLMATLFICDRQDVRLWRECCWQLKFTNYRSILIFRFCSFIKQLLLTALFAQLLILPVQVYFFKTFNLLSFVSSAFFSVLFAFFILAAICLSVLVIIFGYWWWGQQIIIAPLALLIKVPLELILDFISFISAFFSPFTISQLVFPWYFYFVYLLLMMVATLIYCRWRRRRFNYADNSIF